MKIRGVKLDSLFTHAMGKNSGDGYAKEFLECFNADTVLFSESIVSFLKAPTGGKINIAAYNKYNNLNPKTLRLNTYFNCDDIIALSVNGLKKSVPVAVYKIDIGTDSVFEDGGLEIDLSHSLAKGLVSICRSEFENDNKVEFIDNVDDEEYGISEKLTLFFEKNKKIFDKFPSFFEGIKNIFSKKLRIEDILKLNLKPFIIADKEGKGFLFVPYKLNLSLFGHYISDKTILKTIRILSGKNQGLMNEKNIKEDTYNLSVLMICLGMYNEITDKTKFFSDNRFFADNEERTILPSVLNYMNNSTAIKNIVQKILFPVEGFNTIEEFSTAVAKNKINSKKNKISVKGFFKELFAERVRITIDNESEPYIIPFYEFLKNRDGYTIGSEEKNGCHIRIDNSTVQRIHGVIFYDESVDGLIYRRTTVANRTDFEGELIADDYEIFDGALIYIGDVLVKFEYVVE